MRTVVLGALVALSGALAGPAAAETSHPVPAPALHVQTGIAGGVYRDGTGIWDIMWEAKGCGAAREAIYAIRFPKPYAAVPVVTAALTTVDVANATNWRLKTDVYDVTKDGFTLRFGTWCDTSVYSAKVQWTAFGVPAH
ncbi:H-type lectin domain-containing protein [Azospirillum canadense]|uniref:H-type lectin domain-containing protein n=1 Tax=Azospirillum canadense TaxID=403962 RepID=UPI002226649F|nr:H-type lectin domain-containing protein [Azospirillum canadense]MCW2237393.1 hypothetical protein [Azospirillum canadense]